MSVKLNAHRVFKGTVNHPGYLEALTLDNSREQLLRKARDTIRQTLRTSMPQWSVNTKSQTLVEPSYKHLASQLSQLHPRFRMQGSSVYHTLNDPAHKPPQEVDYDDGVFLPTSFLVQKNAMKPLLAAKGYFTVVETTLKPLCDSNGWNLDTTKNSCVRIHINSEAHIDLALYAIPDKEFTKLIESSTREVFSDHNSSFDNEIGLPEPVYRLLSQQQIMLAHRVNGWIESDPRMIEDWFKQAVQEQGEVVRRVCRYLKGWRDFQWITGGPSSIALMACVVTVFDYLGGNVTSNRDDLSLQTVADRLEELFSEPIPNPVLSYQNLDQHWSDEERLDFKSCAKALKVTIDIALNSTYNKQIALKQLKERFGQRIPNDTLLIGIDSAENKILSHEPTKSSAPKVIRTTSG